MVFKAKNLVLLLSLLASYNAGQAQSSTNEWENPQILNYNREKAHAAFMLFSDKKQVLEDDYSKSSRYHLLNGTWKFNYVDKVADRRTDFYRTDPISRASPTMAECSELFGGNPETQPRTGTHG